MISVQRMRSRVAFTAGLVDPTSCQRFVKGREMLENIWCKYWINGLDEHFPRLFFQQLEFNLKFHEKSEAGCLLNFPSLSAALSCLVLSWSSPVVAPNQRERWLHTWQPQRLLESRNECLRGVPCAIRPRMWWGEKGGVVLRVEVVSEQFKYKTKTTTHTQDPSLASSCKQRGYPANGYHTCETVIKLHRNAQFLHVL